MIKTTVDIDGFEGILFPADGRKDKVMIVVSGSNGGMRMTKNCAEFYSKNGVPALAVALFKTKGTQKNLDRVPIEYIESAIKWLRDREYERIGIDGTSKGSEIALLSATMFSELSCVMHVFHLISSVKDLWHTANPKSHPVHHVGVIAESKFHLLLIMRENLMFRKLLSKKRKCTLLLLIEKRQSRRKHLYRSKKLKHLFCFCLL